MGVLKYKAACSVNLECLNIVELMVVFECDWACRCGDFSGGMCVIDLEPMRIVEISSAHLDFVT